jgi:RNA polymerase sigma-70 factor (ECF subfamily)
MSKADNSSRLDAISTRWTLIQQAWDGAAPSADGARNVLVLRYLPAIRKYIAAMVQNREDAEDIAQDALVRLMAGDFAGADPARGRFRDFLKVSIRNMVKNYWTRQKRRRPAMCEVVDLAGPAGDSGDDVWLGVWRQGLLDLGWNAMRQRQRAQPGSIAYTLLRLRADHPDESCEQLAERLSKKQPKAMSPAALRQQLHRARAQFADLLLAELASGLSDPTPQKLEDELIALDLLQYVRHLLPSEWSRP